MATTSPDNIWTPDSGDDYALTVDLAAMADTVQDAITAHRGYRVGTNSDRLALSGSDLFEGLRFWDTGSRVEWLYTSGAWVVQDTGWVDVSVRSGFAPQSTPERPQVRRIGQQVMIRGGVSNTGISTSSIFTVADLPSGFAPPISRFGRAGTSIGVADASIIAGADGTIQVRTNASISSYYSLAFPSWTLD